MRKLTHEEVVERINAKHNGRIKLIGEYKDSITHAKFKCLAKECGHEWFTLPSGIFRGKGCGKCGSKSQAMKITLSQKEVTDRIKRAHGDRVYIIGAYTNSNTHTDFKCGVKECGHVWSAKPNNIFSGRGCPKCGRRSAAIKKKAAKKVRTV